MCLCLPYIDKSWFLCCGCDVSDCYKFSHIFVNSTNPKNHMINFLFYKYCFKQTQEGNLFSAEGHEKVTPESVNDMFAKHLEFVVTKGTKSLNLFGTKTDSKKEEAPESYGNSIVNFHNGVFMLFVHNNKTKKIVPKEIEEEIKVDHHPYACVIVDTRPGSQAILVQQKKNAFPDTDYVVDLILNECAQQLSLWKMNFATDYEKRYHKGSIWEIVKYRTGNGRDKVRSLYLKFSEKKPNKDNDVDNALQLILRKLSADEGELKLVSDDKAKKLLEDTELDVRRTVDLLIENNYSMKIGFERSGDVEYGKKALAIYGLDERVYDEFKSKNPQIGAGGVAQYDLTEWLDTIVPEDETHEYVQTEKTKKRNGRRKK